MTHEIYVRHGIMFVWRGGQYIDIRNCDQSFTPGDSEGEHQRYAARSSGFAVINVLDLETDKPRISTRLEFVRECDDWLTEYASDYGIEL